MTLKEFVEKFICRNTLIRLWNPCRSGHKMLVEDEKDVGMEWELIKGEGWQSKYADHKVIGVTDIVVSGCYAEAVNIVIEEQV